MRVTCAWCRTESESGGEPSGSGGPLPDLAASLCPACTVQHLGQILDRLDTPVLAVTDQVNVVMANRSALNLLAKDAADIDGRNPGEVLDCANATLPGGCGHTPGCKTCVIRNSAEQTWQTGRSLNHVPAIFTRQIGGTSERVRFLVSTRKLNNVVVLGIERADGPAWPGTV